MRVEHGPVGKSSTPPSWSKPSILRDGVVRWVRAILVCAHHKKRRRYLSTTWLLYDKMMVGISTMLSLITATRVSSQLKCRILVEGEESWELERDYFSQRNGVFSASI